MTRRVIEAMRELDERESRLSDFYNTLGTFVRSQHRSVLDSLF